MKSDFINRNKFLSIFRQVTSWWLHLSLPCLAGFRSSSVVIKGPFSRPLVDVKRGLLVRKREDFSSASPARQPGTMGEKVHTGRGRDGKSAFSRRGSVHM